MAQFVPPAPDQAPMAPLPQEQELAIAAAGVDEQRDETFANLAPEGDFAVEDINDLVGALNGVLPFFEVEPYPIFSDDFDGVFPPDFVKQLTMVSEAAADAGLERLSFEVSEAEDNDDLEAIAAKLDVLSNNQSFKTFLRTESRPQPAEEVVVEEEPVIEEAPVPEDVLLQRI